MEEKLILGKFIVKKRKEKNLTQKQLAEKLIVTESAVSKWERGISYPDISIVSEICKVLDISEHELITASEDVHQREVENQAKHFLHILRTYEYFFYFLYGISIVVCFICNLAVDHKLSWFFVVMAGEMVAFSITSLPILVKNNRGIKTLAAFFISLNLLLLICCIYTKGDWFLVVFVSLLLAFSVVFLPFLLRNVTVPKLFNHHKVLLCFLIDTIFLLLLIVTSCIYSGYRETLFIKAIPITLISVILPWILMIIIRYFKINWLLRTGICLMFCGIYSFTINSVLSMIIDGTGFALLPINFGSWTMEYMNGNIACIMLVVFLGLSLVFISKGISKRVL